MSRKSSRKRNNRSDEAAPNEPEESDDTEQAFRVAVSLGASLYVVQLDRMALVSALQAKLAEQGLPPGLQLVDNRGVVLRPEARVAAHLFEGTGGAEPLRAASLQSWETESLKRRDRFCQDNTHRRYVPAGRAARGGGGEALPRDEVDRVVPACEFECGLCQRPLPSLAGAREHLLSEHPAHLRIKATMERAALLKQEFYERNKAPHPPLRGEGRFRCALCPSRQCFVEEDNFGNPDGSAWVLHVNQHHQQALATSLTEMLLEVPMRKLALLMAILPPSDTRPSLNGTLACSLRDTSVFKGVFEYL